MAISIPVTRTKVATTSWGIPITNEVNRLTTQSDAYGPRITALETKTATTAWTGVTFQNGWGNVGTPWVLTQYRKRGDVVEMRGYISGGAAGSVFCTLPSGYRPPGNMVMVCDVFTTANVHGIILMNADGTVQAAFAGSQSCNFAFSVTP